MIFVRQLVVAYLRCDFVLVFLIVWECILVFLDRAKLNPGETLRPLSHRTAGAMGEREVEYFEVVGGDGTIVGEIIFEKDTSVRKPFKTTYSLIKKRVDGTVEMSDVW